MPADGERRKGRHAATREDDDTDDDDGRASAPLFEAVTTEL
jgi:hypothetical protein